LRPKNIDEKNIGPLPITFWPETGLLKGANPCVFRSRANRIDRSQKDAEVAGLSLSKERQQS
jgi:hypothetical protein